MVNLAEARMYTTGGMDFEREDRNNAAQWMYWAGNLKEQAASRKAQEAYNKKKLELERMGLGLQADQIAKQYAMDQAKLEWEKESFREQFGFQVKQQDIDNQFREKQAALDEVWRTAEQTGFRDGVPTMAMMQFNEQTRQFDVGAAQNQRNFEEMVRQFNVGQGNNQRDFEEMVRQFGLTEAERQRQFNVGATGYIGVPGQLTAEQSSRYNEIRARDAQLQAAGEGRVSAADQAELAHYQSILDGTAPSQQQSTLVRDQFNEDTRRFDLGFGEDVRRYDQDFAEDQRRNNRDYDEDVRRYDQNFGEDKRRYDQDFGEGQRQFNVSTVMNAPRGPADWAAYQQKLRGLQAAGSMFSGTQPVASYSNAGQQTPHVLSNVELAMAMTGQADPSMLQGTPWQGMAGSPPQTMPTQTDLAVGLAPAAKGSGGYQMTGADMRRTYADTGAQPAAPPSNDGFSQWVSQFGMPSNEQAAQARMQQLQAQWSAMPSEQKAQYAPANSQRYASPAASQLSSLQTSATGSRVAAASPYSGGGSSITANSPYGGGSSSPYGESQSSAASLPSIQRYRKFSPTEQAMGLGEIEANGGPTIEDSQYLMQRQAPNYERSRTARMAGI
jgi:hypothetical protein